MEAAENSPSTDVARRCEELEAQLAQARDYRHGAAAVVALLGQSPVELQHVFNTIVTTAARLCRAEFAFVFLMREGRLELVSASNAKDDFVRFTRAHPLPPEKGLAAGRAALERRTIHLADCTTDPEFSAHDYQRLGGHRTILGVPLLRDGIAIGVLALMRAEVAPFTKGQIELVETFAGHAAIAIENSRLFDAERRRTEELTHALQQQAATGEVLKTISRSAFDLQTVLDVLTTSAVKLCDADLMAILRKDGDVFRYVTNHGISPEHYPIVSAIEHRPGCGSLVGLVLERRRTVHLPDVLEEPDYRFPDVQHMLGFRSMLGVPMLRDGELIGVLNLMRRSVRPFSDEEIRLVETFADQAVIAINNVELFEKVEARTHELQQALDHQTATSEVLSVISRTTNQLQPVLETIVETAARLCHADWAVIFRLMPDGRLHIGAASAGREEFLGYLTGRPIEVHRGTIVGRTVLDAAPVHVRDVLEDQGYSRHDMQKVGGYRTALGVPLMRGETVLGAISIQRNRVEPFSEAEVELLTTFADQAVIAIDNVRLFQEVEARTNALQEALDYQTATSEVLSVISRSAFDLPRVLDTLLDSAARLCEADIGTIRRRDGEIYALAATFGCREEWRADFERYSTAPDRGSVWGRVICDGRTVHIPDVLADAEFTRHDAQRLMGFRAALGVPLLRDGTVVGVVILFRFAPRSFTAAQIALVETFADQAVIAIENARLFQDLEARKRDLEEALNYQTATSDVLETISRSPGAIGPVLDAIVERAAGLCDAADCAVFLREAGELRLAACKGTIPRSFDRLKLSRETVLGRAVIEGRSIEIDDLAGAEDFPVGRAISRQAGVRTVLAVPLIREGEAHGAITLRRTEVRPFTLEQVARLSTFADQAAIAIENARLFGEIEARTRELAASLEELRSAQNRLVQTEKLASLGQLTAGIAHEIKNPLNFVNNFAKLSDELLQELAELLDAPLQELGPEAGEEARELFSMVRENLAKIAHHGNRADSIVKNMLQHARHGAAEWRAADINAIVEDALNLAYHGARAEHPDFTAEISPSLERGLPEIECCPQDLMRVILNLVSNGIYAANKKRLAAPEGFSPRIDVATRANEAGIEIEVRDNGTGIPAEIRERIFIPFFTTKPAGEGTGLGLSLSHDIVVKQHGGTLAVESEVGCFTLFRVTLPCVTDKRGAKA